MSVMHTAASTGSESSLGNGMGLGWVQRRDTTDLHCEGRFGNLGWILDA